MSTHNLTDASRPPFDDLLAQIADYTLDLSRASGSAEALDTARLLSAGHPRLRPARAGVPGVHEDARPGRARRDDARHRRARARHLV